MVERNERIGPPTEQEIIFDIRSNIVAMQAQVNNLAMQIFPNRTGTPEQFQAWLSTQKDRVYALLPAYTTQPIAIDTMKSAEIELKNVLTSLRGQSAQQVYAILAGSEIYQILSPENSPT